MTPTFHSVTRGLKMSVATAALLCLPTLAAGQEIDLNAKDGSFALTGELVEYQDNVYVLRTAMGTIRVSGEQVDCVGGECPNVAVLDNEVTIAGSDTVGLGLVPVLMAAYAGHLDAEQNVTETIGTVETNARLIGNQGFGDLIGSFRVRSTISSDAFANLLGKSAEIGMSSRRITKEEAKALKEYGAGSMVSPANEHIIASDSIVVITHPDNPIKSLSLDDLSAIYSGRISNWRELGGADAPIHTVHLARGSGTRSIFEERVLDGAASSPANVINVTGSEEASKAISADPSAIGYVSFAFKYGNTSQRIVDSCGLVSDASEFAAKTGEYLLQRSLFFYTREDTLHPDAANFLNWSKSDEANGAIAKSGFIDLGIERVAQTPDSARAQNLRDAALTGYEASVAASLVDQMDNFERLSTTFRFQAGSSRLTPQGRVELPRLVDYLAALPPSEVALVGFTDDQGPFDGNLRFANERASQMEDAIRDAAEGRLDHITFTSSGFGELAPVACNSSEQGRAINRRVEVWVAKPAT